MLSHTSIHFLPLRWDNRIHTHTHTHTHTHIQTTVKNSVPHHSRNSEFLPGSASGLLVEKFRPWSRVRARYSYEPKEWKLKTKAFFHTDRKETTFVRAPKFDPTIIENNIWVRETSGFQRRINEICPLLGLCAGQNGSFLPMCRDKLWVPFSRVKQSFLDYLKLEDGTESFPEPSVTNYHSALLYMPSWSVYGQLCRPHTYCTCYLNTDPTQIQSQVIESLHFTHQV